MACNGGLPSSFNEYKVCYSSRYREAHVVSVVIRMTTIVPGLSGGTVHVGICVKHSTIVALDFSFLSTSLGKVGMY
jgi:undecaprenyl pyrophosphate phosphatase UppP